MKKILAFVIFAAVVPVLITIYAIGNLVQDFEDPARWDTNED